MSSPKGKRNAFLYAALSLVALAIFAFSFFFETIPYHDGAGFDGTFYQEVFRSFSTDFFPQATTASASSGFSRSACCTMSTRRFPFR